MKKQLFKGYSAFERRDFLFAYLLTLIPILHFIVFWVYVNFSSFFLAFQDVSGNWGFSNFELVFEFMTVGDDRGYKFFDMVGRSFSLWAIGNVLAFPIGLATTYVLFRRVCGHYAFRIFYSIPGIVGSVVWATMVKQLFEANGAVVYLLKNLGVQFNNEVLNGGLFNSSKTSFLSLQIMTFLMGIAGGNAVITGAFARIPDELYEVGKLDGIGFWTEFFKVAIPCIWPTIATMVTFSLCGILVADGNVYVYSNGTGGPAPDRAMSTMGFYFVYYVKRMSNAVSGANESLPYGYLSAVGMFVTAVTIPIVLIGRRILDKIVETVET